MSTKIKSSNLDSDLEITGTFTANTFVGSVSGSATSLETPRTLTIGSTGKQFDGTADVAWSLSEIGVNDSTLTLATSGIATGSQTFTSNQGSNATFTVNVPGTNLAISGSGNSRVITSSTGNDVTIPVVTTTNAGFMATGDKTKLDGIETGAQVNVGTNLSITNGTTAGPVINSSTGSNVTFPTASGTISGAVTTGNQTFSGVKTFSSNLAASVSVTTPLVTNAGTLALSATGANIITASTNGTERLRIDSSGNVGIGTSSPSEKLHIVGNQEVQGKIIAGDQIDNVNISNVLDFNSTTGLTAFRPINLIDTSAVIKIARVDPTSGSNGAGLEFQQWDSTLENLLTRTFVVAENGDLKFNHLTNGNILFSTNGNEKVRITSSGNVGIGTSSPSNNLTVLGTTANESGIVLNTTASSSGDGPLIAFSRNSSTIPVGSIGNIRGGREVSGGFLAFSTVPTSAGAPDERMRINAAGNVGIGTTSPSSALTVEGTITGTAVTQSATDTTAGRLLKVGDFGLGATQRDQAASVLDANELPQATGLYVYRNLLTPNAPSTHRATVLSNAWATGSGNDSRTEFAIEARTGTRDVPPRAFVRDYREGGTPEFSVWGELYSNYNILGTVSESSGVPTGAIIERGSNANGEFVKYADGTLICTSPDFTLDCDIAFENIFRSESTTWTYPSIFSDIPRGAAHTINSVIPIAHTRLMSSSAQLRLSCGGARTGDRCAAVAIGRWF